MSEALLRLVDRSELGNLLPDEAARLRAALAALPDEAEAERREFPRPFVLHRSVDHTGVSGAGDVAEGVVFTDGSAVVRWRGAHASTVVWASLDDALHVHGHGGATVAVFAPGEATIGGAQ